MNKIYIVYGNEILEEGLKGVYNDEKLAFNNLDSRGRVVIREINTNKPINDVYNVIIDLEGNVKNKYKNNVKLGQDCSLLGGHNEEKKCYSKSLVSYEKAIEKAKEYIKKKENNY